MEDEGIIKALMKCSEEELYLIVSSEDGYARVDVDSTGKVIIKENSVMSLGGNVAAASDDGGGAVGMLLRGVLRMKYKNTIRRSTAISEGKRIFKEKKSEMQHRICSNKQVHKYIISGDVNAYGLATSIFGLLNGTFNVKWATFASAILITRYSVNLFCATYKPESSN